MHMVAAKLKREEWIVRENKVKKIWASGGAVVNGGMLTLNGVSALVQFSSHIVPTQGSYSVALLDVDGNEAGEGEVSVRLNPAPLALMQGYHADAEKTRSAYLAPGIATLGDVGYVTDDGFVHITDRVADMVVSGGVNLYPAESEKVLLQHPLVGDVAVIGVPDGDLGEALKALVVPADPAPDPGDLAAWCRERLASYKCPKTYEVVDALPRNVMGKLDKRALRRPYWEGDRTIAG